MTQAKAIAHSTDNVTELYRLFSVLELQCRILQTTFPKDSEIGAIRLELSTIADRIRSLNGPIMISESESTTYIDLSFN